MAHLRLVPQAVGQEEELRIFTVEWDPRQQKFVALDDNRMPLGASPNQSNAVSRAIQDARIASCYSFCRVKLESMRHYRGVFGGASGAPPPRESGV